MRGVFRRGRGRNPIRRFCRLILKSSLVLMYQGRVSFDSDLSKIVIGILYIYNGVIFWKEIRYGFAPFYDDDFAVVG